MFDALVASVKLLVAEVTSGDTPSILRAVGRVTLLLADAVVAIDEEFTLAVSTPVCDLGQLAAELRRAIIMRKYTSPLDCAIGTTDTFIVVDGVAGLLLKLQNVLNLAVA